MSSGQLVIANQSTPLSEKDWDGWMDFVREEFLVKDRRIEDVCKSLQQLNPQVTYGALRTKLRQWGFHKSLSAKNWQYVDHSIQKRKLQEKDSVIVLSGVRLDQEKVKSQTQRHKSITLRDKWRPPPSPKPPGEDVPLQICSPRAQSSAMASTYEWPKSLPWLQFSENLLPELMSGLRLLPEKETGLAITESASHHPRRRKKRRSSITEAWTAFEKLVRRGLEIVIGSEELYHTLLLSKSVDRIAGHLDDVIPATYRDENLRRAVVLSGGTQSEVQREVVKILVFLASNHLIMDHSPGMERQYIDDARAFVDVCRLSGLTEPYVLTSIVDISLTSPTMTAVVDLLYEAAINTEAIDLVHNLLTADERIDPDRAVGRVWWSYAGLGFGTFSALDIALLRGSPEFATYMIGAGANVNQKSQEFFSPLVSAVLAAPDDMAVHLVQLLLQKGANVNEENGTPALYLAVTKGSFQLIDLLHKAGADLTSTGTADSHRNIGFLTHRNEHVSGHVEYLWKLRWQRRQFFGQNYVTCLGLAASFTTKSFNWHGESTDDEHTALSLVQHIVDLGGPGFDVDGKHKSDALIRAAMLGYTEVISFLYQSGASVDLKNGFLCPVYSAVNWAQLESCRLLLTLGSSGKADYRTWERYEPKRYHTAKLSPLHIAVCYNSCELIHLLIQSGVDVNIPSKVQYWSEKIGEGIAFQVGLDPDLKNQENQKQWVGRVVSPLSLATLSGSWEAALLLVKFGATFGGDDLFRAASAGQLQLAIRLLELGADPDKAMMENENAFHASIRNGHEMVALRFLESGASIEPDTLGLAFKHGLCEVAKKLVELGAPCTGPEFVWVFRIPDELQLRSFLPAQPSVTLFEERSPDGRTFLENAILSGNKAVTRYAFSLDPLAYDSGALCAAVNTTIQSSPGEIHETLQEILRRRKLASQESPYYDKILENTAISLAAYYNRSDIIEQLVWYGGCRTNAAVLPEPSLWVCPRDTQWFDAGKGLLRYIGDKNIDVPGHIADGFKIDISLITLKDFGMTPIALRAWDNWHSHDRHLVSPLFLSIKNYSESTIESLLDIGYKADGHSLRAAIYQDLPFGLTSKLIPGCTDLNASETFSMNDSHTPIQLAALSGHIDLVEVLLAAGADPNAGPWYMREYTLGKLIDSGNIDIFDVLLQHGTDLRIAPHIRPYGYTPLQAAAEKGHLGFVRRLLESGADPNERESILGRTAIENAAQNGRLDTAQLLLESRVSTEGGGQLQYIRAVYYAARFGHSAVVQLLQSHRQWTPDDESILKSLHELDMKGGFVFIRLGEDTDEEIAEMLACADEIISRKRNICMGVAEVCAGIQVWKSLDEYRGRVSDSHKLLDMGSATAIDSYSIDDIEAQVLSVTNSNQGLDHPAHQQQAEPLDEENLPGTDLLRDLETSEIESDTQVARFEVTEEESEDIHVGPHTEVEAEVEGIQEIVNDIFRERAEGERIQKILDDMLGEKEAPFQPVEWSW
ncbi:ankyrin [Hypoxylon sp. NC1633]|nr:ankyrin [Hypoxylon sp. NC1633]